MFTKQHYEAVAEILRRQRGIRVALHTRLTIDDLTSEFAILFEDDSKTFDTKRFLEASGYKYDPSPVIDRLDELDKMAKVAIDRE